MTANAVGPMGIVDKALRAGFIRKVYGILAVQMALTIAVAAFCMMTPLVQSTFVGMAASGSRWLQFVVFIPTAVSLLVLSLGAKNKYPWNYVMLFILTLGISVDVGYACSVLHALGYGVLILQALAITLTMFLGITVLTLLSGKDFSFMGGFLFAGLWGLVITGFIGLFFPRLVDNLVFAFLGALLFCGYIVYDTWQLAAKFSYDDYIGAAIELYLDVVNLFLYILRILIQLSKDGEDKKRKK